MRLLRGAVVLVFLLSLTIILPANAAPKKGPRSNADRELRTRRNECEKDVCTGLSGEGKMTCAYRCISPECFDEVYAKDEIEEGEVDTERGRQFSSCFRKSHKKEQDAKLAEERKQRAAAKTTK
mmetsp:Transcript_92634/g.135398  ORF Transcript_92634/g.135398 Transcript_92634/m.135398 type:complete len:124 (-) Transcript_92634:204-575(-)